MCILCVYCYVCNALLYYYTHCIPVYILFLAGILGADIAHGYLHRIPVENKNTTGRWVLMWYCTLLYLTVLLLISPSYITISPSVTGVTSITHQFYL